MNATPVKSSTLLAVGYDHHAERLQLEFLSLEVYQYFGVPPAVYEALLTATSKGCYFNRAIRDRYRFVRVARQRGAESGPGPAPFAGQRGAGWLVP